MADGKPQQATEAELEKYFKMFDVDGNNQIALSELKDLWYVLYNVEIKNDEEAKQFMSKFDDDDNDTISLQEFKTLFEKKPFQKETRCLIDLFLQIDVDESKYISKEEIKKILNDDEVERFMRESDKDNDGKVSLKEFCLMCRKYNILNRTR